VTLPFSYSFRNVVARPVRSLLTASVIALVVVACTLFLGLISSLKQTMVSSGDRLNLIVLRKGSDNDGSSQIPIDAYHSIRFLDGIERDADDDPLASPELVVQPFFQTRDGGRENVLVRGVQAVALQVHDQVKIVEGRMIEPSAGEAIVGRGVLGRYEGTDLGSLLEFGRNRWKVVGIFESGGSSFESEVWVDVRELARDAYRPIPFSGLRVRAADEDALVRVKRRIDGDPRFALEAERETEYYAKQSESANTLYALVIGVAVLAGIGAGFGAANTMYAAVQARTAEIGTLRAMGFSRGSILWAFEVEAAILAVLGFLLGTVLALALAAVLRWVLGGVAFGAATFTTNVITLQVAAGDLLVALALALVVGIGGGLGPAWRAARLRPIDALRRA
jgi:ABC-type lipoprotein release transport system permease subunit